MCEEVESRKKFDGIYSISVVKKKESTRKMISQGSINTIRYPSIVYTMQEVFMSMQPISC